jgi:alcohol dehydrogenase (cytochrome c)
MKALGFVLLVGAVSMQGAVAADISWQSYNGDLTGQRFSPASQINASNVRQLSPAWRFKVDVGLNPGLLGRVIKSTPLVAGGVLYFTVPDHCWAIDAKSGKELWHYIWKSEGGVHIGNRGVALYKDTVLFATPDSHLISLDARTGALRWSVAIADSKRQYFASAAPLLIKNHLLVGISGDSLGLPGYLESRDPDNGSLQWRWYSEPEPGQPGSETWPDAVSMAHGGGMTWMPGTYDPELNLVYWGTGNPVPTHAGKARLGDNLWTDSIVALDVDTGKMKWWFQSTPHDTHDWDGVQTPVLIDDVKDGAPRKLLVQAARNGYFFVLDRLTGANVVSKPFVDVNWANGLNARGEPLARPEKEPTPDGVLVSPRSNGATNWQAPTFNARTGLFYVSAAESYSLYYLTDEDEHPEGYAGFDAEVWAKPVLLALDYNTGKRVWSHEFPNRGASPPALLSTAGNLLFSGDQSNNFIAFDPKDGKILWHYRMTYGTSNGPMTYEIGGTQFVVVADLDTLTAFALKH